MDLFLLTKPPKSPRAKLCFALLRRSSDARLYLCGDGVYCLLESLTGLVPADRIFACPEDVSARGISVQIAGTIRPDFYDHLAEGLMIGEKVYAF